MSEPVTPVERSKPGSEDEREEKKDEKKAEQPVVPAAKDHSRMDLFWKHNTFGLKSAFGGRADVNAHAA